MISLEKYNEWNGHLYLIPERQHICYKNRGHQVHNPYICHAKWEPNSVNKSKLTAKYKKYVMDFELNEIQNRSIISRK